MIATDAADPPSALPRGTLLAEFEIRRVLGTGGFGIVYLAFDQALEREVAVKEYLPVSIAGRTAALQVSLLSHNHAESFALGLRSFVNEARLLARFDHPSLVKVHRYWEQHNTAYMAMPFYAGHNLQRTRRDLAGPPPEAFVRSILEPLLGALERLHSEGVYHRDISPDNIILAPDGRPVLLDFGAARRVLAGMSVALTAILKPAYAPIEQYGENGAVKQGPWTDLYALGATLRHLLLGQAPAPSTTRTFVDEMVPLAQQGALLAGCSTAFLACIDWMLQPRPADRPQSVAALREALEACRAAMPAGADLATMPPAAVAPQSLQSPAPMALDDDATRVVNRANSQGETTVWTGGRSAGAGVQTAPQPAPTQGLAPSEPVPPPALATQPAPGPDGRTDPVLDRDLAGPLSAAPPDLPASASSAGTRHRPPARRWPLAAAGIGAASLLGLLLWSTAGRGPAPADTSPSAASVAALPAPDLAPATAPQRGEAPPSAQAGPTASAPGALTAGVGPAAATTSAAAAAATSAAPSATPSTTRSATQAAATAATTAIAATAIAAPSLTAAAPAPASDLPVTLAASNTARGSTAGAARAKPMPAAAPAPAAVVVAAAAPAAAKPDAVAAPGGRPGLATSITRLPLADSPAMPAPAGPAHAGPSPAGPSTATTTVAAAAAAPHPAPAVTMPAATGAYAPGATSLAAAPAALPNPAPQAPTRAPVAAAARSAERDNDTVQVQARALSPSERCEGRVLVALWACVERQCKADASLRDHPDCQKLRREQ